MPHKLVVTSGPNQTPEAVTVHKAVSGMPAIPHMPNGSSDRSSDPTQNNCQPMARRSCHMLTADCNNCEALKNYNQMYRRT